MESLFSMVMGGADWLTTFAFFVVALFRYLRPAVGYSTNEEESFWTPMMFLMVVLGIGLLQKLVMMLGGFEAMDLGRRGPNFLTVFALLKGAGFLAAMGFFFRDLMKLRKA